MIPVHQLKPATEFGTSPDANYAQETAELAKTQILQSSASAILVQANSRNDLVRELLKSQ